MHHVAVGKLAAAPCFLGGPPPIVESRQRKRSNVSRVSKLSSQLVLFRTRSMEAVECLVCTRTCRSQIRPSGNTRPVLVVYPRVLFRSSFSLLNKLKQNPSSSSLCSWFVREKKVCTTNRAFFHHIRCFWKVVGSKSESPSICSCCIACLFYQNFFLEIKGEPRFHLRNHISSLTNPGIPAEI
jgi:hypothetical protein